MMTRAQKGGEAAVRRVGGTGKEGCVVPNEKDNNFLAHQQVRSSLPYVLITALHFLHISCTSVYQHMASVCSAGRGDSYFSSWDPRVSNALCPRQEVNWHGLALGWCLVRLVVSCPKLSCLSLGGLPRQRRAPLPFAVVFLRSWLALLPCGEGGGSGRGRDWNVICGETEIFDCARERERERHAGREMGTERECQVLGETLSAVLLLRPTVKLQWVKLARRRRVSCLARRALCRVSCADSPCR